MPKWNANNIFAMFDLIQCIHWNEYSTLRRRMKRTKMTCNTAFEDLYLSRGDNYHTPLRVTVVSGTDSFYQFDFCKSPSKSFNFRKANFLFYYQILKVDWSPIWSFEVDLTSESFYSILQEIFEQTVHYKIIANKG